MTKHSPIEHDHRTVDPTTIRQWLGVLTTKQFRASVLGCELPVRKGVFESILHLRTVSDGNARIRDREARAARDVQLANLVGQLNEVSLRVSYEDTSVRRVLDIDTAIWKKARSRGRRQAPGVQTLLRIFFTTPEAYVDRAGEFLPDLDDRSRDFRYGKLGGFVLEYFTAAGDDGHMRSAPRVQHVQGELRHTEGQEGHG